MNGYLSAMNQRSKGFTIVELLIVIVVIGILAAITIVSYTGVQNRGHDAAIQSDLKNIARSLQSYFAVKGSYPGETGIAGINSTADVPESTIRITKDAYDNTTHAAHDDTTSRNLLICVRNGTDPQFGIAALSKSGKTYFYTSTFGLTEDNRSWVGQQTSMCPRLGIALTDAGYARSFGYSRSQANTNLDSGWSNWALGQ